MQAAWGQQADCMLLYRKNQGRLYARIDGRECALDEATGKALMAQMSNKQKDKAADGKLAAVVAYNVLGNRYTVTAVALK